MSSTFEKNLKAREQRFQAVLETYGARGPALRSFKSLVWFVYRERGRSFPRRETRKPYAVFVSELMLQQTQTSRVLEKYPEFLSRFPDFNALAAAPLQDVLQQWQGLGYNRRALALKRSAEQVVSLHKGRLPRDRDALIALPGVGEYTASALRCFIWDTPEVIVETNIRTVFYHCFFREDSRVDEGEFEELVRRSSDTANPRDWYYALMDYGSYLKSLGIRVNKKNPSYRTQSRFEGSQRQIRGSILRELASGEQLSKSELQKRISADKNRILDAVAALEAEGMLRCAGGLVRIA